MPQTKSLGTSKLGTHKTNAEVRRFLSWILDGGNAPIHVVDLDGWQYVCELATAYDLLRDCKPNRQPAYLSTHGPLDPVVGFAQIDHEGKKVFALVVDQNACVDNEDEE